MEGARPRHVPQDVDLAQPQVAGAPAAAVGARRRSADAAACRPDRRHVPLPRARLGRDAPGLEDDEAVAEQLGVVEVVRDDDRRHVPLVAESGEDRGQPDPRLVVEAGVRLVEHEQHGIADEQPGEGDPPLLASGQLVDSARAHRDRIQPDRSQGGGRPVLVGAVGDVGTARSGG